MIGAKAQRREEKSEFTGRPCVFAMASTLHRFAFIRGRRFALEIGNETEDERR
ncbi:hypothetical protein [Halomonas denitrificans]|nr:hypothetical protein [Halomonas denitrificans]